MSVKYALHLLQNTRNVLELQFNELIDSSNVEKENELELQTK